MLVFILIVAAGVAIYLVVKGKGYWGARTQNKIKATFAPEEGYCCDCRYCAKDESGRYSQTGYFCRLSNASDITEATRMNCFEKPIITAADLEQLFSLGVWNERGKDYLRQELLNKRMTYREMDAFLKRVPNEHPGYIDQKERDAFISRNKQ